MPRTPKTRKALAVYRNTNPSRNSSLWAIRNLDKVILTTDPVIARLRILETYKKLQVWANMEQLLQRDLCIGTSETRAALIRLAEDDTLTLQNVHEIVWGKLEVVLNRPYRALPVEGEITVLRRITPVTHPPGYEVSLVSRSLIPFSYLIRTYLVDMPTRVFRERPA